MTDVAFHPDALADLDEIWDYIAGNDINAADGFIADILGAIGRLPHMPQQGHRRPDLTGRPLRFVNVREYLIAYAPDHSPMWIIAILHGRRNPRVLAAILRARS